MGYDLERADGAGWGTTSVGWRLLRHLAERFGLRPAGTLPPEDWGEGETWSGKYHDNSGQRVVASDAAGLAAGLRVAAASPEFDGFVIAFGTEFSGQLETASTPTVALTAGPFPPVEWRRVALEFASYCEGGAFRIH